MSYRVPANGPEPTWIDSEIGGKPAGGIRTTPPWGYHDIMFSGWLNNVHLAQGMMRWGKETGSADLQQKARLIINLALSAPQTGGIFPGLYNYERNVWKGCYWQPPARKAGTAEHGRQDAGYFETGWASKTAMLLLRYDRYYDQDSRIVPYVRSYADFIKSHLDECGCLPAWFTKDLNAVPNLRFNAQNGMHIAFLAALYELDGDGSHRAAAQRMADFLIREILPQQRWYDWETFYSCSAKPEETFDSRTGQWPRSTMSMIWAVEGFTALFDATGEQRYLQAAERTADYLSLYQSVWQPQFMISCYAFGGFLSQNSDAEWLEMRQCMCAEALVHVGIASGRQDLLERGVAALRASFALIHLPRNIDNKVFEGPMYPLGISPENADHEGVPQLCLRSGCDWGEGGALAAAAELLRLCGSVYIDPERTLAVGVDGVAVHSARRSGKAIHLKVENLLSKLPVPWDAPLELDLEIRASGTDDFTLTINRDFSMAVGKNKGNRPRIRLDASPSRS
jgi:hypothetical protein